MNLDTHTNDTSFFIPFFQKVSVCWIEKTLNNPMESVERDTSHTLDCTNLPIYYPFFLSLSFFYDFSLGEILRTITSGPLFFQLFCSVVQIAACLNLLENVTIQIMKTNEALFITHFIFYLPQGFTTEIDIYSIESIFCVYLSIFCLFMYCLLTTRISMTFSLFRNVVWSGKWYGYPNEMQKMCIFILRYSQVDFEFDGLGIVPCDLEVFGKVTDIRTHKIVLFKKNLLFHYFSRYD